MRVVLQQLKVAPEYRLRPKPKLLGDPEKCVTPAHLIKADFHPRSAGYDGMHVDAAQDALRGQGRPCIDRQVFKTNLLDRHLGWRCRVGRLLSYKRQRRCHGETVKAESGRPNPEGYDCQQTQVARKAHQRRAQPTASLLQPPVMEAAPSWVRFRFRNFRRIWFLAVGHSKFLSEAVSYQTVFGEVKVTIWASIVGQTLCPTLDRRERISHRQASCYGPRARQTKD